MMDGYEIDEKEINEQERLKSSSNISSEEIYDKLFGGDSSEK